MVRSEKRIERLRQQPNNAMPEQVKDALLGEGFTLERVTGSHWMYRHPALIRKLIIPYRRPVKPVYVREALDAIDEVRRYGTEDG